MMASHHHLHLCLRHVMPTGQYRKQDKNTKDQRITAKDVLMKRRVAWIIT
jgi:hypothetical protein